MLSSWDAWAVTILIVVVFPLYGWILYSRVTAFPQPPPVASKLAVYAAVAIPEWLLVALMARVASAHGIRPGMIGEGMLAPGRAMITIASLSTVLAILTIANLRQIVRADRDELNAAVSRSRKFLPIEGGSLTGFAVFAVTSGVYRGWLVSFLAVALGNVWIAVFLGAFVFGAAHLYQGPRAYLGACILGLIFGAIFVGTQSLIPGQVLHMGIALVNGIAGGMIVARLYERRGRAA